MNIVTYIRATSCHPFVQIPADHITQQSERIKDYAKRRGWRIAAWYCDRKQNSEECTAFDQMVEDGIQRKFDMVVVDSVYSVGRDLWSAREVLLQTFHYAGISFAVVEDDFVSEGRSISEVEAYFQNASKELKKAILRKRNMESNQCICWNDIKYGYRLSDHGEMVIDNQTAPIVQDIFQMRLSGMSVSEIAAILNQKGIPVPRAKTNPDAKWAQSTIRKILQNSAYAGHWIKTVQGNPVLFENEAIISEEDYAKVQKMSTPVVRKAGSSSERNLFASLVVDEVSGETLRLKKSYSGERFFSYEKSRTDGQKLQIPYENVEKAVLDALEKECQIAQHMEQILPEGMELRKQEMLAQIREDMRSLFEETAEAMKYEGGTECALQAEPLFQKYMDTVQKVEVAFSHKNPWIKLYSGLKIQSLDSNASFRHCIEKIIVGSGGAFRIVPKEASWKQILICEERCVHGAQE